MDSKIILLPSDIAKTIRSNIDIIDISQVILELVSNSIDAQSKHISITINTTTKTINIMDNGIGINGHSMNLIGQCYCTSKIKRLSDLNYIPNTLGYRGQFLTNLAQVTLMKMTSKAKDELETYHKIIEGGKVLSFGLLEDIEMKTGLNITISNFMYNRPIRKKEWNNEHQDEKLICDIQEKLFKLLLPFPSISLRVIIMPLNSIVLNLDKNRKTNGVLCNIFKEMNIHLISINEKNKDYKIKGKIISPLYNNNDNRHLKYIYVNKLNITCKDIMERIDDIWYSFRKLLKIKDMSMNDYIYFPGYVLNISIPRNVYEDNIECGNRIIKLRKSNDLLLFITESMLISFKCIIDDENNYIIIKNKLTSKYQIKRNMSTSAKVLNKRKFNLIDENKVSIKNSFKENQNDNNDDVELNKKYKRHHSAPPFYLYKNKYKGYHSNPICSLRTDSLYISNNKSYSIRNTYTGIQHKLKYNSIDFTKESQLSSFDINDKLLQNSKYDDIHIHNFLRYLDNDYLNDNKILNIKNLGENIKPKLIDRKLFLNVSFLKQVSNKFLIIKNNENLIAIDQHAADERIKYEMYTKMLYNDLKDKNELKLLKKITKKGVININKKEYQIYLKYKDICNKYGWNGTWNNDQEVFEMTSQPQLFDKMLNNTDFKILLYHLNECHGNELLFSSAIRILKYKACKTAIKFNDVLTDSQCINLINELEKTKNCFSCAHGRPTMVPLLNIRELKTQLNKLNINH